MVYLNSLLCLLIVNTNDVFTKYLIWGEEQFFKPNKICSYLSCIWDMSLYVVGLIVTLPIHSTLHEIDIV